jgi:hypothetical protein
MNTRTLMRALRGIVDQEHNPFPFATHENRGVLKTGLDLLEGLKMILHALVVRGVLRLSRPINRLWHKRLPVATALTGRIEATSMPTIS